VRVSISALRCAWWSSLRSGRDREAKPHRFHGYRITRLDDWVFVVRIEEFPCACVDLDETHMVEKPSRVRTVRVVPYDPGWPESFEVARRELSGVVPDAVSIEHVGSTSVPGLVSKPTVDILLVVRDLSLVLDRVAELGTIGFEYRPGSFSPERQHLFFRRIVAGERTHHLHVLPVASPEPGEYRLFRDFLRANPDAAARYATAKLNLADRFARDRTSYVEAKESVVEDLLVAARTWMDEASRHRGGRR